MKFLYEQSDIPPAQLFPAVEQSWGYCSMSGAFCAPPADQGILVAAIKAPNERISMVHRLQELENSSRFSDPAARQLAISLAAHFAF